MNGMKEMWNACEKKAYLGNELQSLLDWILAIKTDHRTPHGATRTNLPTRTQPLATTTNSYAAGLDVAVFSPFQMRGTQRRDSISSNKGVSTKRQVRRYIWSATRANRHEMA